MIVAKVIFWIGVAIPLYTVAGYPALLFLLRRLLRRPVHKGPVEPFISILIPAYNEADVIESKIRHTLALDYPAERCEIVVACDGCRDSTAAIAKQFEDGRRVRVLDYPVNRGKIATLNESVPQLRGEIVVFSDASAFFDSTALRKVVFNFADPAVGAVSGRYTVIKPDAVNIGNSEDVYWRYETWLRDQESQLSSTLGGHGQLHAIRKPLYPFPPPGTINDDYVIPLSVIHKGYRAVYEPGALVYEEAEQMTGFGRRVRIMAGNFQQLRELRPLIWPPRPLPLLFFVSRKVLRLTVPFAMITALLANLFLLHIPLYAGLFVAQCGFYLLALLGMVWRLKPKTLLLPFYFCMVNAATFFGAYHALTSRRRMAWK